MYRYLVMGNIFWVYALFANKTQMKSDGEWESWLSNGWVITVLTCQSRNCIQFLLIRWIQVQIQSQEKSQPYPASPPLTERQQGLQIIPAWHAKLEFRIVQNMTTPAVLGHSKDYFKKAYVINPFHKPMIWRWFIPSAVMFGWLGVPYWNWRFLRSEPQKVPKFWRLLTHSLLQQLGFWACLDQTKHEGILINFVWRAVFIGACPLFTLWKFPEMAYHQINPNHPFSGIFQCKPSINGGTRYPLFMETPETPIFTWLEGTPAMFPVGTPSFGKVNSTECSKIAVLFLCKAMLDNNVCHT